MELTLEDKQLIISVLSQIQFKIGESELARKYELLIAKLKEEPVK